MHASTVAAAHLSPAYPVRAAWGTADKLRAWQEEAVAHYLDRMPRDFLAVATPGSGKTTFALRIAAELLHRGAVRRVCVVAPTEHLKKQWADAGARVGIQLDPRFRNAAGDVARGYDGPALTYAQVAARPHLHRGRTEAVLMRVTDGVISLPLLPLPQARCSLSWVQLVASACSP